MQKIIAALISMIIIVIGYIYFSHNIQGLHNESTNIQFKQEQFALTNTSLSNNKQVVIQENLMWASCILGMERDYDVCKGSANTYNFNQAIEMAKSSNYAGFNDWRLPTLEELHAIVLCSSGSRMGIKKTNGLTVKENGEYQNGKCLGRYTTPTIDTLIFPNTPAGNFISYTYNTVYQNNIWLIDFKYGYDTFVRTDYPAYVRLVRDIK